MPAPPLASTFCRSMSPWKSMRFSKSRSCRRSGGRQVAVAVHGLLHCALVEPRRFRRIRRTARQALPHLDLEGALAFRVEKVFPLQAQKLSPVGEVIGLLPLHAGIPGQPHVPEGITQMRMDF